MHVITLILFSCLLSDRNTHKYWHNTHKHRQRPATIYCNNGCLGLVQTSCIKLLHPLLCPWARHFTLPPTGVGSDMAASIIIIIFWILFKMLSLEERKTTRLSVETSCSEEQRTLFQSDELSCFCAKMRPMGRQRWQWGERSMYVVVCVTYTKRYTVIIWTINTEHNNCVFTVDDFLDFRVTLKLSGWVWFRSTTQAICFLTPGSSSLCIKVSLGKILNPEFPRSICQSMRDEMR